MLIAYASGAANPTQSQSDFIVDLLNGDTLPTTAQLYGGGVDSNDPAAVLTFNWSLLRKPLTSNGALNDPAVQNPIMGAVDVWGNYLLFLIVTNPATGESSEIDPLAAPSTAFVRVRVRSQELGLEKPAAGERDWQARAHEWVDAIENHESRIDDLEAQGHNLNDLLDVTINTPSSGQGLVYNGVEWVNSTPATALNIEDESGSNSTTVDLVSDTLVLDSDNQSIVITHSTFNGNPKLSIDVASTLTVDTMNVNGDLTVNADNDLADPIIYMKDGSAVSPAFKFNQIDQEFEIRRTSAEGYQAVITEADHATIVKYGVVRIESNSTGYNTNARILDVERLMFTAIVDGMVDYKADTQQHKTNDPNHEIEVYSLSNIAQQPALIFKNVTGEAIGISDISLVMASSGVNQGNEYAFSLVAYTTLNALATNSPSLSRPLPAFQRVGNNQAGACDFNYVTDNGGTAIGIPADAYFGILVTSQPDYAGNRLQCTIQAFREIL